MALIRDPATALPRFPTPAQPSLRAAFGWLYNDNDDYWRAMTFFTLLCRDATTAIFDDFFGGISMDYLYITISYVWWIIKWTLVYYYTIPRTTYQWKVPPLILWRLDFLVSRNAHACANLLNIQHEAFRSKWKMYISDNNTLLKQQLQNEMTMLHWQREDRLSKRKQSIQL